MAGEHLIEGGAAVGQKIKRKHNAHKRLCKHMEIEISGMEKKVWSFTDSAVVEVELKLYNEVAIEKVFLVSLLFK